jgi:hypothetical protein
MYNLDAHYHWAIFYPQPGPVAARFRGLLFAPGVGFGRRSFCCMFPDAHDRGKAMKTIMLVLTVVLIFVAIVTAKRYLSGGEMVAQTIPIHGI